MNFFPIAVHIKKFVYSAKLQSLLSLLWLWKREVKPQGVGLFHSVTDGQQILWRPGETEVTPSNILEG